MTSPPPSDGLADLFWSVARRLRHHTKGALSPWDLNPSHARALRTLGHHGTMRPGELAKHLRIAPRSATEVVDDLEERGLVARRPDPGDRRAVLVELTEAGTTLLREWRAERHSEAERFFADLTPADRAELVRILHTLTD
ncbi:MAG: MarR family transcriptional regulator [Actinomycetota bacterium]|nr:MarR family transcriptional regulator [Actinomycetota bacterium]